MKDPNIHLFTPFLYDCLQSIGNCLHVCIRVALFCFVYNCENIPNIFEHVYKYISVRYKCTSLLPSSLQLTHTTHIHPPTNSPLTDSNSKVPTLTGIVQSITFCTMMTPPLPFTPGMKETARCPESKISAQIWMKELGKNLPVEDSFIPIEQPQNRNIYQYPEIFKTR